MEGANSSRSIPQPGIVGEAEVEGMRLLEGKTAVITGGGSGLGREIAVAYAAQGARVVVSSNVPDQDEQVARTCTEAGGKAIAFPADVRNEGQLRALVERTVSTFGGLDVFVAGAGLDVRDSPSREDRFARNLSLDAWQTVIETNLTGTFLSIREALRHMVDAGSGSIITFSSGTVRFPRPGLAAYASSKCAIEGLTQVVAQEVRADGIRVNAIQPGGITDTGFFPEWTTEAERATMHKPSVIRGLATYLASDESRDVTGQSLIATEWNRERGLVLCPCPSCVAGAPPAYEWAGLPAGS